MADHPIERFDPLLRNLLTFGLVQQDASGAWRLTDDAARRLDWLATLDQRSRTSGVVIYFGHNCAGCHEAGPTRRHEDRYLCDPCRRAAIATAGAAGPEARPA